MPEFELGARRKNPFVVLKIEAVGFVLFPIQDQSAKASLASGTRILPAT